MALPINQPEGPVSPATNNALLDYAQNGAELSSLLLEKTRLQGEATVLGDRIKANTEAIQKANRNIAQAEAQLATTVSEEDPIGEVVYTTPDKNQVLVTVLTANGPKVYVATVKEMPTERQEIPAPPAPEPEPKPEPEAVTPEPKPAEPQPEVVGGETVGGDPAPTPEA